MSYKKFKRLIEFKILKRTFILSLTTYYKKGFRVFKFRNDPIFLFRIGKYQWNFELKKNVL